MTMENFKFCQESASLWQIVGWLLLVFKIVIPVLLIIFGMVDLGKAVVSSDDKAVQKAGNTLLKRLIMGIAIFFVPTVVGLVFRMVGGFTEVKTQYNICATCITNPGGDCACFVDSNSHTDCATRMNKSDYVLSVENSK